MDKHQSNLALAVPITYPLSSRSLLIDNKNGSKARLYKIDESGSPYFSPLNLATSVDRWPLTLTRVILSPINFLMHLTKFQ